MMRYLITILLAVIAAASGLTRAADCVQQVHLGSDLIAKPQTSLTIRVRFNQPMDENTPLIGQINIQDKQHPLNAGRPNAGGLTWEFAPVMLGKQEGVAILKLTGARARKSGQLMTEQSFDFCIGTGPLERRLASLGQRLLDNHLRSTTTGAGQRTLLALHEITGNRQYMDRAKAAARHLLRTQNRRGYWLWPEQKDIRLADSASIMTALLSYHRYSDRNTAAMINRATASFLELLGEKRNQTFIHPVGSIGAGFHLNPKGQPVPINRPDTISTALVGAEFFACLYYSDGNPQHKTIAVNACNWLLNSMNLQGQIPSIAVLPDSQIGKNDPNFIWEHLPYTTSAAAGQGLISAWTYIPDPAFRANLADRVRPHIEWLLRTQNNDGSWAAGEDQLQSHGIVSLLVWYYHNINRDPRVVAAIRKYYMLLLNRSQSRYLKIEQDPIAAAHALAVIIKPGIDYPHWK